MKYVYCILTSLVGFTYTGQCQVINNIFDESPGQNFYQNGFGSFNWVDATAFNLTNNAGNQAFLSANGTGSTFNDLGLVKELGDTIEDTVYIVSFYIAKYTFTSISFNDFSELRIGGSAGTYQWIQTPAPVQGQWQQWVGIYTPDTADIGDPFDFVAVFDLPGNNNSIAIDGPVTVVKGNITSVEDIQNTPGINYFPNPVKDILTINSEKEIGEIKIYDVVGKLIYHELIKNNNSEVNLKELNAGIYFVEINNSRIKFVKE